MAELTIRDIARIANVSSATVSRCLNNSASVKPETAKRVMDVVNQCNFVPNDAARSLKTNSSSIVAFLICHLSNTHFTKMAKVIDINIRKAGYNLIISGTEDDPQLELESLTRLQTLNIQGLILNTTGKNDDFICELSKKIPVALVDRNITNPNFFGDFVGSNGYSGVYQLAHLLIRQGHTKIAFINSNLATSTGRERLAGFKAAMQTIGILYDENYIYQYSCEHFNEEGGIAGCRYLMNLPDPPTAIVIANNAMAIGAYKFLHYSGIKVPDDVSIASFGNINNSDLFRVEPTIATLNPEFIGERASNMLISRIENPALGNRESLFEPLLVEKETTCAPM